MSFEIEKLNKAKQLHLNGKIKEAQLIYLELISKIKDNYEINFLLGTSLLQTNNYKKAIDYLNSAIDLNSNFPESYNSRGVCHLKFDENEKAIIDFDKAILLKTNFFDAYLNKAIALKNISKYDQAAECYQLCIKLNPNNPKIYNNLGNLLKTQHKYDEALNAYNKAIKLKKDFAEAYNNRGDIFVLKKNVESASKDFELAVLHNKDLEYTFGKMVHTSMQLNDWNNYNDHINKLKIGIDENKKIVNPHTLFSLIDNPDKQKMVSENYNNNLKKIINEKSMLKYKIKKKIKIGYFSGDFYNHPVLHCILDVFKHHNKSRFEVYAFNHSPKNDTWTELAKIHFKKFINILNISNEAIKKLCQENEIDIAINLTGLTQNNRESIFYQRVAPIQINYLGYPGTLGSKCYDFIIADEVVLPKNNKKHFFEKVLYLPDCFLPYRRARDISKKKFAKNYFKLPENKFIFACFNTNYKITPEIFDAWMKILIRCENSIIWLLQENILGRKNLIKEANKRGVDSKRIIFADRVADEEHLKRHEFIDLYLDTYPYNAHSTASNVIRMGVPLITLQGNSLASRVASSILTSINLKKLITTNIQEYVETAVKIANDKKEIAELKKYLKDPVNTNNIFDSQKFTKNLEKIYENLILN